MSLACACVFGRQLAFELGQPLPNRRVSRYPKPSSLDKPSSSGGTRHFFEAPLPVRLLPLPGSRLCCRRDGAHERTFATGSRRAVTSPRCTSLSERIPVGHVQRTRPLPDRGLLR